MRIAWTSLGVSFGLVVASGVAVATSTACMTCSDPALREGECTRAGGAWDEGACSCAGARPFVPPPSPACASDHACAAGHCLAGACVTECFSDLDCRTSAHCVRQEDGKGICKRSCTVEGDCSPGFACRDGACSPAGSGACGEGDGPTGGCGMPDLGTCTMHENCRVDAGASCTGGRCYGPLPVDAGP